MKTKTIALVIMMFGLAIGVASAQSAEPLKFRTPFAFVVGDRLMPAGQYTVQVVAEPGTLWFHSADGKASAFIRSITLQKANAETRNKMVFHRYGAHYYISEIWTPGEWVGRSILQHPSELELARGGEPQHVTVYVD